MPKLAYAFEPGGQKHLEVVWKGMFKDVTVSLDGTPVGVIPNQKALAAGQEFRLVDGSIIKVQLVSKLMSSEIQVLRDGKPLPGSSSDPQARLKNAYGIVYFVAGLNLVLGLIAFLFRVPFLQQMGIGFGSIIFGLVFLILAFFVQRKSLVALILAISLFALDGLLTVYLAVTQGHAPGTGGLIARGFLLIPMIQGIGAIKVLRQKVDHWAVAARGG